MKRCTTWRTQRACAAAFRHAHAPPALVLAAGASHRFGGAKALARYGDRSLLDHAIELARQLSGDIRVITGCRAPLLPLRSSRRPTSWLYAEDWPKGMSASLKRGILTLPPAVPGVFVMLVDQPLLAPGDLNQLREAAHRAPATPIAADYDGRPGVPAYLPRHLWPDLLALEGDRGAVRILAAAAAARLNIEGVTMDVDTPAELARLNPQVA